MAILTGSLFNCQAIETELTTLDLWRRPTQVACLLEQWQTALALAEDIGSVAVWQHGGVDEEEEEYSVLLQVTALSI